MVRGAGGALVSGDRSGTRHSGGRQPARCAQAAAASRGSCAASSTRARRGARRQAIATARCRIVFCRADPVWQLQTSYVSALYCALQIAWVCMRAIQSCSRTCHHFPRSKRWLPTGTPSVTLPQFHLFGSDAGCVLCALYPTRSLRTKSRMRVRHHLVRLAESESCSLVSQPAYIFTGWSLAANTQRAISMTNSPALKSAQSLPPCAAVRLHDRLRGWARSQSSAHSHLVAVSSARSTTRCE
jgi:hypothetical protein